MTTIESEKAVEEHERRLLYLINRGYLAEEVKVEFNFMAEGLAAGMFDPTYFTLVFEVLSFGVLKEKIGMEE
jgi:hypothetical protein